MEHKFFTLSIIGLVILIFGLMMGQACLTLNTYKTEFLPKDTMQLEIGIEYGRSLVKDVYSSDLFLYRNGQLIHADYYLVKVSSGKFFAWFNVPNEGDYTLKVKAQCDNGFSYTPIEFKVNRPKSVYYDSLIFRVDGKWANLKIDEVALASAALSYDGDLSEEALENYFSRKDSCLNTNCSTKNAALALISFRDFSTRSQLKNRINSYQNNLQGQWFLEYVSGISQDCNLSIGNVTRLLSIFPDKNIISLDLSLYGNSSKVLIADTCNLTSRKILFRYEDIFKNFTISNNFEMQNLACFGNNTKNSCDAESTAYALFSMYVSGFEINDRERAVSWLSNNANSADQVAVVYLFTKEENKLNQILASQTYYGAWQKKGVNDVQATVTIYYVLNLVENKNSRVIEAIDKAKKYLDQSLSTSSLADESYTLFFVFPNLEPLMSIWPGIIRTQSGGSFNIIMQNSGPEDLEVTASIMNSSMMLEVQNGGSKNLGINVPIIKTSDGRVITEILTLQYSDKILNSMTRTYTIPVLIATVKGSESNFSFIINQSQISENQTNEIMNESLNNTWNYNLSESIIKQNFYFSEGNITRTIYSLGIFSINANLVNKFPNSVGNITIQKSASLSDLEINPSAIDLIAGNDSKTITIYVDPSKISSVSKKLDGRLEVSGDYNGADISTLLYMNFVLDVTSLKACRELQGTVCIGNETCRGNNQTTASDGSCCLSSCDVVLNTKTTSKNVTVAIVIIVVILIVLVGVLFFLKRRPRKGMKEFMDSVSSEINPYDEISKPETKDFKDEFRGKGSSDFGDLDSMGDMDKVDDFKDVK
jgi:hypothetical protein